jgi:uracil-DNA glycosylase
MSEQKTPLQNHIEHYEIETMLLFKPSRRFYDHVGINPKRFWQLVKGTKKPFAEEMQALSEFCEIPINSFFNTKN